MGYEIGQTVPLAPPRPLFRKEAGRKSWYVLQTRPAKEMRAKAFFLSHDIEAWFPTDDVWVVNTRGKRRKRLVQKIVMPGYVFAEIPGEPIWDRLLAGNDTTPLFRGVVSIGGRPAAIGRATMLKMAKLPELLAAERRAIDEATKIKPGDTVHIHQGPLTGLNVTVIAADPKFVRFIAPFLGGAETRIEITSVTKSQGDDRNV